MEFDERVPSDYRRVILDCCGDDQLRKLSLKNCQYVDPILELLPIKRLESLSLWNCKLTPLADARELAERVPRATLDDCTNRFLCELKELDVKGTCLGYWSRLFECRRPLLTQLKLNCSHLGILSLNSFDWSDAFNLWPYLMELGFYNERPATLYALKSISPHLNDFQHLKQLIVPILIYTVPTVIGRLSTDILAQTGYPLPVGLRVAFGTLPRSLQCHYHQEQHPQLL